MNNMDQLVTYSRRSRGSFSVIVIAVMLAVLLPSLASAHAVVFPKKSASGAYERYVLRVPNEKTVATTRVEIHFPEGLRITDFEEVPGWTLEVLPDSTRRIVGAVWTGNLPPQRFVEFPFMAANPKTTTNLVWPVYQTYEGMPRVDWTGPKGSKTPASITAIAPVDSAVTGGASSSIQWVQWIALVVAIIALGVAMRPKERAS